MQEVNDAKYELKNLFILFAMRLVSYVVIPMKKKTVALIMLNINRVN